MKSGRRFCVCKRVRCAVTSRSRDLVKKITEEEPSENIPDWLMAMNLTASDPERGAKSEL